MSPNPKERSDETETGTAVSALEKIVRPDDRAPHMGDRTAIET